MNVHYVIGYLQVGQFIQKGTEVQGTEMQWKDAVVSDNKAYKQALLT